MNYSSFIDRWSASGASERANKDAFLVELCDLLEVDHPEPASGDPQRDTYVFEKDVRIARPGGSASIGRIDLYKQGCFVLEAKQGSDAGSAKIGAARRGTPGWNIAMRKALGQALGYARTLDDPPPFLVVCDIGYCFDLHAAFDGTGNYRPFPSGRTSRIFLRDLDDPKHLDILRRLFLNPRSLDPSRQATRVTREIAAELAVLARDLGETGHDSEAVATFLMRCLFTMFAEDVDLLPGRCFTRALEEHWIPSPASFVSGVQGLWSRMNTGGEFFPFGVLKQFNGALFKAPRALPLTREQLERLLHAAQRDWSDVEPAIFGTLLERALDPAERHRLGAHYTPRAYVERLIRPTVEEPLREEWETVQAEVQRLVEEGNEGQARKLVREFHQRLTSLRVLDPACGTANFLYVAFELFKRLETEVVGLLEELGDQAGLEMQHWSVTPEQFRGIEVKRWSKEIAELVLWIGYLQWQVRHLGGAKSVPDPVLRDYGNIEHRDAVLAWDGEPRMVRDEDGEPVTHWDGTTTKLDPVTGNQVPDEEARVPVFEYAGPRPAPWPKADFIVGNPPFLGNWKMRSALGHGYTETLRKTYPEVPESVDYVMYWWHRAAELLRAGSIRRFGLITTNSITQKFARRVLTHHMNAKEPLSLVYAIPDHPWVDAADGAAVRIAMTVARQGEHEGVLGKVVWEEKGDVTERKVEIEEKRGMIHSDLTIGPNVVGTVPLRANEGLSCPGVKLHGKGFRVTPTQARELGLGTVPDLENHIRPYLNGNDLLKRSRNLMVIDLYGLTSDEVRERFPAMYQWLVGRVKPEREQNNRRSYRDNWWIFGEPRSDLRAVMDGLERYIATVETSKHRLFTFLPAEVLPDNMLVNIALDDSWALGVLSSSVHVAWALAAGGTLEDRPRYNKTRTFDPFPFPDPTSTQGDRIGQLAEAIERHRDERLLEHDDLTLSKLYSVLEKECTGTELTDRERSIHERGLIAVLRELHDELDAAVLEAYGWPADLSAAEILEHLVALNRERAEEERNGHVRWLRPELQAPDESDRVQEAIPGTLLKMEPPPAAAIEKWPQKFPERLLATRRVLTRGGDWTVEQVAATFKNARRQSVREILESLQAVGVVLRFDGGAPRGELWRLVERRSAAA